MSTMNRSFDDEVAPLIPTSGIPRATKDGRQRYEKRLAVYTVLGSILFERIAFYTLVANLATKLETKSFKGENNDGTITSFIFSGTTYIFSIIFAIISDWKLGRARTVIFGFFVYLIGYVSAIVLNVPNINEQICTTSNQTNSSSFYIATDDGCVRWILTTLIVIAIGAAAVQSNMAVLGAEQIQKSKLSAHYFDKYIVAVNLGGIIATLAFLYMTENNEESSRSTYLEPSILAASALIIAALLFIMGWRYYIHVTPYETVVVNFLPVFINAFQSRRKYDKENCEMISPSSVARNPSHLNVSQPRRSQEDRSIRIEERPTHFLDFAKLPHGKYLDRIVDDVKSLRNAIIVFLFLIPYFLIYSQLSSTFPQQAKFMGDGDSYRVTYMWLSDPIAIIVGLLIFNTCIYKCLDARNKSISIATRFIIGMFFATLSMCVAGTVEYYRQNGCSENPSKDASTLPIYWQLPQNILIGLSEVFLTLASFEFAYFSAPLSAQTLFMSLRFCSIGISSFLGFGYMAAFAAPKSFTLDFSCTQTKNSPREFYTYFFVLAGIQLLFILIFILCEKKFRIIKFNRQQMETDQFVRRSTSLIASRY